MTKQKPQLGDMCWQNSNPLTAFLIKIFVRGHLPLNYHNSTSNALQLLRLAESYFSSIRLLIAFKKLVIHFLTLSCVSFSESSIEVMALVVRCT